MSESCPACTSTQKGQDIAFENALNKANEYSKENKVPVAVYKENGEWIYTEAFAAYRAGKGPLIRQVVSPYNRATS
jgi:hypothetical protein